MTSPLRPRLGEALASLLLVTLVACGGSSDVPAEAEGIVASNSTEQLRYTREFIFVSPSTAEPTVVPFEFSAVDDGSAIERTATAWLGRGATWDRFLEESQTGARAGGVWRVVPYRQLRVAAGGPLELETLRFEREERRLRLDLTGPPSSWTEAGQTRFRVLSGRLVVGTERLQGPVLEVLNIERVLEDGWAPTEDFDGLFLTSGDSVQLVVAESMGPQSGDPGYGWIRSGDVERAPTAAEVRWLEMRPLEEARREIPLRWSFAVPGFAIEGEVEAIGHDIELGPERGGRRAVEIRYTVAGWYEAGGVRRPVVGMVRHLQR